MRHLSVEQYQLVDAPRNAEEEAVVDGNLHLLRVWVRSSAPYVAWKLALVHQNNSRDKIASFIYYSYLSVSRSHEVFPIVIFDLAFIYCHRQYIQAVDVGNPTACWIKLVKVCFCFFLFVIWEWLSVLLLLLSAICCIVIQVRFTICFAFKWTS